MSNADISFKQLFRKWSFLVGKKYGNQFKKYDGTDPEDLLFDLQAGLTKKLENSTFSFSFTAHLLHQFDFRYNEAGFNADNGFGNYSTNKFTVDKIYCHFVLATTIYMGDKAEVAGCYNYLRRKKMEIGKSGNGLNGFSIVVSLLLSILQARYARSHYQNNTTYNQFGLI